MISNRFKIVFVFYLSYRTELYGIFLGMCLNAEIINDSAHITLFICTTKTIVSGYCTNSYHNFLHAFDVAYMVYYMLKDLEIGQQLGLSRQDKAVLLIAALGHDVKHPGLNNLFQVRVI